MGDNTTITISLKLKDLLVEKSTRKDQTYEDIIWSLIKDDIKDAVEKKKGFMENIEEGLENLSKPFKT